MSGISEPVLDLLAALHETIAIPYPATVGDEPAYRKLLADRALRAQVVLEHVLQVAGEGLPVNLEFEAGHLRRQLAKLPPTTYTHDQPSSGRSDR